jgi:hypothetical protein
MVEAAMNDPTALEALDLTVYTRHLADRGDLTAEKVHSAAILELCRACWTSGSLECGTQVCMTAGWCMRAMPAWTVLGRNASVVWRPASRGRLHPHLAPGTVKRAACSGCSLDDVLNRLPPVAAQGLSQSVMVDLRMELLAPYAELRPERDPPRVRSPLRGQPPLVFATCMHGSAGSAALAASRNLLLFVLNAVCCPRERRRRTSSGC